MGLWDLRVAVTEQWEVSVPSSRVEHEQMLQPGQTNLRWPNTWGQVHRLEQRAVKFTFKFSQEVIP